MTPKNVCIPRELQLQAAMFRLGNVDEEIHAGYEILQKYHKTVTFFGSARISEDDYYYQKWPFNWQKMATQLLPVVAAESWKRQIVAP